MRVTAITGGAAPVERDEATRAAVARAAREFEAMFLLQMLKEMRHSMLDDEDAEPGLGAGTMGDTIDSELARQLAGHAGLADALTASMTRGIAPTAAALPAAPAPVAVPRAPAPAAVPSASTLQGRVSSDFGWRQDPLDGRSRFHKGVDIAAAYGKDVPAAAGGVVVSAGTAGGYGESVVIDHGHGLRTRYAHLSAIGVAPGAVVAAGQAIGRVGQSGRATGPHLHFEVLDRGTATDPALLGLKLQAVGADYPRGPARTGSAAPGDHDED